jgi:hypothetical protein
MRHLSIVLLFFLVLAYSSQAQAADTTKARSKEAKKACAAGDFRKGVEILAGLYVDTDDIAHIYNQARCYEQNHQFSSAIDRFHEVLRKTPNQTAIEKADVEKHIADCEAFLEKEQAKALSASVAPPVASPPTPALAPAASVSVPLAPAPPEPVGVNAATPTPREPGKGLRVASIVLASAGVATAVTGLVLNLKANSLADDFNRTQDPATRSSSSSYKTGSMICYGVGAGALVAAGVLYFIGRSAGGSENNSQVSFLPALTPTGFSLDVRRPF